MKKTLLIVITAITAQLSNAQNVGIGTSTPGAKLHVIGNGVSASTSTLILRNAGLDTLLRMMDNGNMTIGYTGSSTRTLALGGNGLNFYTPNNGPYQGGIYPSSSGNSLVVSGGNHLILQAEGGGIGIGTPSPATSAALEVSHPNKGILFPRVADTSSISTPVKGLVVFSNASNKLWYYNGSQWQSTGGGAGAGDLWYEMQDSIMAPSQSYININTDPNLYYPVKGIQMGSSLFIQGKVNYSKTAPTVAQTFTMNNTLSQFASFDSVGRIYDPGGTGNYLNNMQSAINIMSNLNSSQLSYRITSVAADFGLGTGDTVWVSSAPFPDCRDNYDYRITNTGGNPQPMVIDGYFGFYISFKSNTDGVNGKGFNFLITRIYGASSSGAPISSVGPAMYFNSDDGSFAVGNNASAEKGIAIGSSARTQGGLAIGFQAIAGTSATNSAFGFSAKATGTGATAVGYASRADGPYSVAMLGHASGQNSVAIGYSSEASGNNSFTMGDNADAVGYRSTAMGFANQAIGDISTVLGSRNLARGYSSTVLGVYNAPILASAQTAVTSTTPLFIVGNGDDNDNRSNAMAVLKNGNVGIGNNAPKTRLHIDGGTDAALTDLSGYMLIGDVNSTNLVFDNNEIVARNNGVNSTLFLQNSGGAFEIGGTAAKPGGGSWSATSDARLKQNVLPYTDGLQQLLKINPVYYQYNQLSGYDSNKQYIGVLAQDLKPIAPYMVNSFNKNGTEYYSVDNTAMTYMLINSVKEQQAQIAAQQKEIEELKKLVKKVD